MVGTDPPLSSRTLNSTSTGLPPSAAMTSFMRRAFELLVRRILERHQQHAFPASGRGVVVVPVGAGDAVLDLIHQPIVQRRIFQPLQHGLACRPRGPTVE